MRRLAFALFILAACKESPAPGNVPVPAPAPAPAPVPEATTGPIGVAACDEYLTKMSTCVDKLSPESQKPMRQAMEDARRNWKATATRPEARTQLASACQQALDAGKSAAQAMGCPW